MFNPQTGPHGFNPPQEFSLGPSQGHCRVVRLLICEVLPQHNQYLRPYQVDTSIDVVRQLENIVMSPGNITPQSLAVIPNGFLSPSATIQSAVPIINGWNEKRFRFMLEVNYSNGLTSKNEIICGFTDHPGITLQGNHLDPNMVFYINSIVPMIRRVTSTQYGNIEQYLPSTPSHLIGKDPMGEGQRVHVMTPQTIMNQLVLENYDYGNALYDLSGDNRVASFSNRNNTNGLRYSSKLFTSFKDEAITDSQSLHGSSNRELLSNVRGRSYEDLSTGTDLFLNEINGITGEANRTYFTFRDLMRIDNNVTRDDITQVVLLQDRANRIKYTQHLAGADGNTQAAVNIANILPTIMLDYGIVSMAIASTNNTIGLNIQTFVTNIQSLSGSSYDLSSIIPTITNRINDELIRTISFNNQVVYTLDVKCDLIGETVIMLGYDSNEPTPYIVPTFADTLFNPILSDNKAQVQNVANGFSTMFNTISSWIDGNKKHLEFHGIIPNQTTVLNDL